MAVKKMVSNPEENLEIFKDLIENIKDIVYSVNNAGIITYISPVVKTVTGRKPEELIGKNFMQFIYEEDIPLVTKGYNDLLKGNDYSSEFRVNCKKKGETKWVKSSGKPILKNGKIVGLRSVLVDITEEKKIKEELIKNKEILESEKKFTDEVINSLPGVFYLISPDFKFVRWNKNFTVVTGYSDAEMKKISPLDLFEGEDKNSIKDAINEVFVKDKTLVSADFLTKKGKKMPYYFTGSKVILDGKNYLIGMGIDVSDRKKSEENLKASEEKLKRTSEMLQRIIDLLPSRIFWKDKDLKYLGCNTIFAKDAGKKSPKEMIGKDDFSMGWKDQAELYRADDFKVIKSKKPVLNYEEPQTTPDGKTIWLRTSKVLLTDKGGNVQGILGTYSDITKQKKAEEELKKSEEKFRGLYDTMDEGVCLHEMVYNKAGNPINYKIIDINPAYEKIVNVKNKDIIGKNATEAYGISKPPYLEIYAKVASTGEPYTFETYFPPMSKYFAISCFSTKKGQFATIFSDITERRRAEETLKKSESLLNEVGDIAKIGGWEMDISTGKATWTKGTYDIVGIRYGEDIPGLNEHVSYYVKEDRPVVKNAMDNLIKKDILLEFEARFIKTKGGIKWIKAIGKSERKNGKCIRVYGTLQDITAKKNAEEELLKSAASLEQAETIAKLGYFERNWQTGEGYWSKGFYKLLGLKENEIDCKHEEFMGYIPDYDKVRVAEHIKNSLEKKTPLDIEFDINQKDGKIIHIHGIGNNEYINGKPLLTRGTFQDITIEKEAEDKLEHRNEELEKFNKLAVDRELKMVKLKKRIEELEKMIEEK